MSKTAVTSEKLWKAAVLYSIAREARKQLEAMVAQTFKHIYLVSSCLFI